MATATLRAETEQKPAQAEGRLWERFVRRLFDPVDIGMVAFFRIAFGVIMAVESMRYLREGWVAKNYTQPDFHFTFPGFGWVQPWPGIGMTISFVAMGVLGLCIAAGFLYRVTTILFALNFAHIFLIDQSYYLNHFYLITIVSFLLCFLPANRAWSVDAKLFPKIASTQVPAWTLWLLRFQVAIAYFYGGIAKLNSDWLHGEPMRMTLAEHTNFPLIGQWFTEEWMVAFFTWGGLLFDLLIIPALLWPKTRFLGFLAALLFNLTNSVLFEIGIFPWFMVASTLIFFPPEWLMAGPETPAADEGKKRRQPVPQTAPAAPASPTSRQKLTASVLVAWAVVQLVLPFRHLLYPGDVSWTEEGHYFAWHMKLRRKAGESNFTAVTRDGKTFSETALAEQASPELLARMKERAAQLRPQERHLLEERFLYVTPRQRKKMAGRPEMILQYAHFLAGEFERSGYGPVAIYCDSMISLNGRAPQRLIDPEANLAEIQWSWRPASWIVPLHEELPDGRGRGPSGVNEDD